MRNKLQELAPVETYTVAEHRYLWNEPIPDKYPESWREVRDAAPYKAGEVVYVAYGDGFTRAYIERVDVDYNRWTEWREFYWVRRETKKGLFAKVAYKAYSGYVQRGYQRAGLAPDVPE